MESTVFKNEQAHGVIRMKKFEINVVAFLTAAVLLSGCAEQQKTKRPPVESGSDSSGSSYITENRSEYSGYPETDSYPEIAVDPIYYSSSVNESSQFSSLTNSSEPSGSSASSSKSSGASAASSFASSSKPSSASVASSSASSSMPPSSSVSPSSSSSTTSPASGSEQCSLSGHTVVIDDGVLPTCQTTGLTQGAHCSVCNEVLKKQYEIDYYHIYLLSDIEYPFEGVEGKAEFTCIGDPADSYDFSFSSIPTEQEVYDTLISFKSKYPEGMTFTNSTAYRTQQMFRNINLTGGGCAAFAFELSDAAFGEWTARFTFDFSNIRVGDIIRLSDDQHSVIVLAVDGDTVTIAEANYNSSVHWGRKLSLSDAATEWNYMITRYPE